ncbi:hypothetical protein FOCC_FOCC006138 [Frankliniella occidentalis]|nr:hypothetical protein FOCC_FOCC006138 [Frankliniella occidentalis]
MTQGRRRMDLEVGWRVGGEPEHGVDRGEWPRENNEHPKLQRVTVCGNLHEHRKPSARKFECANNGILPVKCDRVGKDQPDQATSVNVQTHRKSSATTKCDRAFNITSPLWENVTVESTGLSQIYSDWANHYLEKAKCKRRIKDLQADVADGVLLSDVVEAVNFRLSFLLKHLLRRLLLQFAGLKVPDINRKPKSSSQMAPRNGLLAGRRGRPVSSPGEDDENPQCEARQEVYRVDGWIEG